MNPVLQDQPWVLELAQQQGLVVPWALALELRRALVEESLKTVIQEKLFVYQEEGNHKDLVVGKRQVDKDQEGGGVLEVVEDSHKDQEVEDHKDQVVEDSQKDQVAEDREDQVVEGNT